MGRLAKARLFFFIYLAHFVFAKKNTKNQGNPLKIQMFEFLSQSLKFVVGAFLILNYSLLSLTRFSAFLGLRYADNAITWSFTVFWHSYSLFFFCRSLFCFLNLALFITPLRTGTV